MKGMWDMAIHQFSRAVSLNDRSPLFHMGLAEMHLAKGDMSKAVKSWESALELDPNNAQALTNISAVAMEMHDWEKAIVVAKRAIDVGASSSIVHYNMGMSCLAVGASDLAIEYLEKACIIDDQDPSNRLALGEAYVAKGELDKGISCWESILEGFPDHLDALYNLGLIYLQNHFGERSKEYFTKVLEISPGYLPARINLGIYYHMLGEYDASLKEWEEVLLIDAENLQALGNIVEILILQNKDQDALHKLDQALGMYPQEPRLLFLKGWLLWKRGELVGTLQSWQKAGEANPEVLPSYADRVRDLLGDDGFDRLKSAAGTEMFPVLNSIQGILGGELHQQIQLKQEEEHQARNSLIDRVKNLFRS